MLCRSGDGADEAQCDKTSWPRPQAGTGKPAPCGQCCVLELIYTMSQKGNGSQEGRGPLPLVGAPPDALTPWLWFWEDTKE